TSNLNCATCASSYRYKAMNEQKIQHYAEALYQALVGGRPIDPLTAAEPDMTIQDVYRIQLGMIERRLQHSQGERVVGKKIGVTSQAVMDMLKVDQPDFGHLTSSMVLGDGAAIAAD